jgi:hypothetical protein
MNFLEIARQWERGNAVEVSAVVADVWRPKESAPFDALSEQLEHDDTAAQLRAIAATLTPVEGHCLAAEAATADRLALHVLAELLVVRCPRCGGDRWRPAHGDALERCAACGAPAPFTDPANGLAAAKDP